MCALHLHYTLNAILIPHINHYYQALCLALCWEVSLGCSYTSCFVIMEVKNQQPLLFVGLASHQVFLPTYGIFKQNIDYSEVVRISTGREKLKKRGVL